MSNNYIKEFWEWSKNSYGHDKSVQDAQTAMTSFNSQHGYGSEGQWVLVKGGHKVFIEKIEGGNYTGFDKNGNPTQGSMNDIIRTLMKPEVIEESSSNKNKRYGVVMLYFNA